MSSEKVAASCPHCGVSLNVKPSLIGTNVLCPKCRRAFTFSAPVPALDDNWVAAAMADEDSVPPLRRQTRKKRATEQLPKADNDWPRFLASFFSVVGVLQLIGTFIVVARLLDTATVDAEAVSYVVGAGIIGAGVLFAIGVVIRSQLQIELNTRIAANVLIELLDSAGSQ